MNAISADHPADVPEDPMTARRIAYEEACDAELLQWSTQIVMLKAKTERADPEIRMYCRKALDALQLSHEKAERKQLELKTAKRGDWEGFRAAMDEARMLIRISFCGLVAKLS
ncbi:MAG TPA: hypothetical protein DCS11_08545 [Syntrophus sp. (in: bacteria)]|nr:hypothetical protein [Syntrophus sp. (in: bacteria)]